MPDSDAARICQAHVLSEVGGRRSPSRPFSLLLSPPRSKLRCLVSLPTACLQPRQLRQPRQPRQVTPHPPLARSRQESGDLTLLCACKHVNTESRRFRVRRASQILGREIPTPQHPPPTASRARLGLESFNMAPPRRRSSRLRGAAPTTGKVRLNPTPLVYPSCLMPRLHAL